MKTLCNKCSKEITNNNWKKHFASCSGQRIKKIYGIDFDPNHGYKNGTRVAWNKGRTKETDLRVLHNANQIKVAATNNPLHGQCSDPYKEIERRKKLSARAKESGLGGYREGSGRCKKHKVFDSQGNQTTLQGTYELAVFEILCELGINWVRPKALKYDNKNYFADFYLPDFDLWLDPKNDYKALQDMDKIIAVLEQNSVNLLVLSKEQITKQHIGMLIQR